MVSGNPLQIRNFNLPSSLIPDQYDAKFSMKLRFLLVVLDEILTLKYQTAAVIKKAIGGVINIVKLGVYRQRVSVETRALYSSDANILLQYLVTRTAKYRYERCSNDSDCCCEIRGKFAWVQRR